MQYLSINALINVVLLHILKDEVHGLISLLALNGQIFMTSLELLRFRIAVSLLHLQICICIFSDDVVAMHTILQSGMKECNILCKMRGVHLVEAEVENLLKNTLIAT